MTAGHLGDDMPHFNIDAVRRFAEHGVAVLASDIGDPVAGLGGFPPGTVLPLYVGALTRLGMPLIDGAEIEGLAAVCRARGGGCFCSLPLPYQSTGVPVSPLAIFWTTGARVVHGGRRGHRSARR
ncbi:hypothetical protein [Amycolatopsis sp. cmx-4-61]|uniref:hypothetical protein n=1 Tax=Amycolatopsis sp. cmx-4-61 TaxID=2790937 RepID=UPI00397A9107